MSMPWSPSDPARWAVLGLADPTPGRDLPQGATVADVLAWALVLPSAIDPVEGIVDAVRVELRALASVVEEKPVAGLLAIIERRLSAALILLRYCDGREPMRFEPDEVPDVEEPTPASVEREDVEVTRDAPPSGGDS